LVPGTYVYTESSTPRQIGNRAWLQSPMFAATGGSAKCMHFWYNMHGFSVGSLTVYVADGTLPGNPVWTLKGNQGSNWNSGQVTIQTTQQYSVSCLV